MRRTDPKNTTRSYFRSGERIFALNGQWFYATREGDVGPFSSRTEALAEVDRFLKERRDLEHFQLLRDTRTERADGNSNTASAAGAAGAGRRVALALVPKEEAA